MEVVSWKWCGGSGVVEVVWWKWCGVVVGVVAVVSVMEVVWWKWCGGSGVVSVVSWVVSCVDCWICFCLWSFMFRNVCVFVRARGVVYGCVACTFYAVFCLCYLRVVRNVFALSVLCGGVCRLLHNATLTELPLTFTLTRNLYWVNIVVLECPYWLNILYRNIPY